MQIRHGLVQFRASKQLLATMDTQRKNFEPHLFAGGVTVYDKYQVEEELMGVSWLLALQAIVQKDFALMAKLNSMLVMGECANFFCYDTNDSIVLVLRDTAQLRLLANQLITPSPHTPGIRWGVLETGTTVMRLSMSQVLARAPVRKL